MNCKFLKQALCLVIGICASYNIAQSMENSDSLNFTNVNNH